MIGLYVGQKQIIGGVRTAYIYMYNLNLCESSNSTLVLNLSNWVNGKDPN